MIRPIESADRAAILKLAEQTGVFKPADTDRDVIAAALRPNAKILSQASLRAGGRPSRLLRRRGPHGRISQTDRSAAARMIRRCIACRVGPDRAANAGPP